MDIRIRDVVESDLPIFLEHERDPVSARMAAFGPPEPDASTFATRWTESPTGAPGTRKTVVVDGDVVGFVASFLRGEELEVTYWIARSHWGRGIATVALAKLLECVTERPIHASAASDNVGSLRVLANCGFVVCGSRRAFASARGEEIEEVFLELR
jgi:RimJ/RimL family protein N-acetyltransferase